MEIRLIQKFKQVRGCYLGFKHLELAAAPGPAEQFTSVSGGDAGIFWNPLLHVPVVVQVVGTVVLLALLFSETLPYISETEHKRAAY